MKIFITGGFGFVGRHLYKKLIELNHFVYQASYDELPKIEYDIIIHLAAVTSTSPDFNPRMYDTNIVYANKIMQYQCRILYASSTSAAENTNPYAATKMYLEYLGERHNNATGLRFFNVYGENNTKGIVKKAIECAETGDTLQLQGGMQIRDFIYIDDVVNAIINNLNSDKKIVEVGTGYGISIFHAINTIEKVLNKQIRYNLFPKLKTDMEYSVASPGLPDYLSFENGLRRMLK